jgi:hypothetical protein
MTQFAKLIWFVVLLALAGCGGSRPDLKLLDQTLDQYASVRRWGKIEDALAFVDPEVLARAAPTSLELERWRQVKVASYRARPYVLDGSDRATQWVDIDIVNVNTQVMRSIVDRQQWRYDASAERWWLSSGLSRLEPH